MNIFPNLWIYLSLNYCIQNIQITDLKYRPYPKISHVAHFPNFPNFTEFRFYPAIQFKSPKMSICHEFCLSYDWDSTRFNQIYPNSTESPTFLRGNIENRLKPFLFESVEVNRLYQGLCKLKSTFFGINFRFEYSSVTMAKLRIKDDLSWKGLHLLVSFGCCENYGNWEFFMVSQRKNQ